MKNRIAIKCPLVSFVVSLVVTRLLATSSSSSSIAWDIKPIGHKVMRKERGERKDFIGFIAILNCIPCTTTTFFSPFPKFSIHKLKDWVFSPSNNLCCSRTCLLYNCCLQREIPWVIVKLCHVLRCSFIFLISFSIQPLARKFKCVISTCWSFPQRFPLVVVTTHRLSEWFSTLPMNTFQLSSSSRRFVCWSFSVVKIKTKVASLKSSPWNLLILLWDGEKSKFRGKRRVICLSNVSRLFSVCCGAPGMNLLPVFIIIWFMSPHVIWWLWDDPDIPHCPIFQLLLFCWHRNCLCLAACTDLTARKDDTINCSVQ